MFGKNPIRPPVSHDGSALEVKSIFPTLQGEGPYVGWPSVFIRLGGCNLACSFCDTEFEEYETVSIDQILARVKKLADNQNNIRIRNLVVITGGEPLRQNISPLCDALIAEGFMVQIETNGTLYRALPEAVNIVCSPKNTGAGYFPLRSDLLPRINAFKFLISVSNVDYADVADVGQNEYHAPVYVQPMDEYDEAKNSANLKHALALATQHGYRLSLQLHKLVGIE